MVGAVRIFADESDRQLGPSGELPAAGGCAEQRRESVATSLGMASWGEIHYIEPTSRCLRLAVCPAAARSWSGKEHTSTSRWPGLWARWCQDEVPMGKMSTKEEEENVYRRRLLVFCLCKA